MGYCGQMMQCCKMLSVGVNRPKQGSVNVLFGVNWSQQGSAGMLSLFWDHYCHCDPLRMRGHSYSQLCLPVGSHQCHSQT